MSCAVTDPATAGPTAGARSPLGLGRRGFLKTAAAGLLLPAGLCASQSARAWALLPPEAGTAAAAPSSQIDWRDSLLARPRVITLHRAATGERESIAYWTPQDGILRDGYIRACNLLRDVQANRVRSIDPKLLDLLCGIQYWLAYYGHTTTLEILSGFRTFETNERTEGSAKNSLHMEGMATDFMIAGLPTNVLGAMVSAFSVGGIGFYLSNGFIHADTGRVRAWVSTGKVGAQRQQKTSHRAAA